jgi:hypothetical protein
MFRTRFLTYDSQDIETALLAAQCALYELDGLDGGGHAPWGGGLRLAGDAAPCVDVLGEGG